MVEPVALDLSGFQPETSDKVMRLMAVLDAISAAINLKHYAASSAVSACGEFSTTDPPGPPGRSSQLRETGTEHQNVPEHA